MNMPIIEYTELNRKWLVFKYPSREIKKGTSLIVRPGQKVILCSNGKIDRIYSTGKYMLDDVANTRMAAFEKSLGNSTNIIVTDIYFINISLFMNNGWGTKDPVVRRDNELGVIRLTAFGNYTFKIFDAELFVNEVFGNRAIGTETGETMRYISNLISSLITMAIGASPVPFFDMAAQYETFGNSMLDKVNEKVKEIGIEVTEINVENIGTVGSVNRALDEYTQMNVANMNFELYEKYQQTKAMREAASIPRNAVATEIDTVLGKRLAKLIDVD